MQVQAFHVPCAATPLRRRGDVLLLDLTAAYQAHGGIASPHEVVGLMRAAWRQPVSTLAKWIVARRVVSFEWQAQLRLPMFQFDAAWMTPHAGVADAVSELAELMDDEGVAAWFVHPSEWLGHAIPAQRVVGEPDVVIAAARRTRLALVASRRAN